MPITEREFQIPAREDSDSSGSFNDRVSSVLLNLEEKYNSVDQAYAIEATPVNILPTIERPQAFERDKGILPESTELLRIGQAINESRIEEVYTKFSASNEFIEGLSSKFMNVVARALPGFQPVPNKVKRPKYKKYVEMTPELLINWEGELGATVIEPDPNYTVTNFHVEGLTNADWFIRFLNAQQERTWHYTVLEDSVIKATSDVFPKDPSKNNVRFEGPITQNELHNLVLGAQRYEQVIQQKIYNKEPSVDAVTNSKQDYDLAA